MAKLSIDIDKINNELISVANAEVSNIKGAQTIASGISFPEGDYGWSSIKSRIDSCCEKAEKYSTWASNIHSEFTAANTSAIEDINSNTIEEVKKSVIVVK